MKDMQEMVRFFRTLYLIAKNSKKQRIVLDVDDMKYILDSVKNLAGEK